VYSSVEVVPVEVVARKAMVPVEAMVHIGSTEVTAPGSVTAHASRLTGRGDRKHDRQCGERQECDLFRTYKLVHGDASLSPSTPLDGYRVTPDSPHRAPGRS